MKKKEIMKREEGYDGGEGSGGRADRRRRFGRRHGSFLLERRRLRRMGGGRARRHMRRTGRRGRRRLRYLPRVTHAHTSQSTTPDAVRALFLRDRRTFMCACSWACNCACWAAWAYAADARVPLELEGNSASGGGNATPQDASSVLAATDASVVEYLRSKGMTSAAIELRRVLDATDKTGAWRAWGGRRACAAASVQTMARSFVCPSILAASTPRPDCAHWICP